MNHSVADEQTMSLGQRVLNGSAQISAANILARLFVFLAFPLLSRWIGPAPYGVYSLAATFVGLASTMGLVGLDMSYARYFLDRKDHDKYEVESFCWSTATMAAVLSATLATCFWLFFSQRFAPLGRTSVAIFLPAQIIASVLVIMATTRMRLLSEYRRLATAVVSASLASTVITLALAASGLHGVVPLLIGGLSTSVLTLIRLGLPKLSALSCLSTRLAADKRREIFSLGLSSVATSLLYWLISSSDSWFLVLSHNETDLGVYSIAKNIALSGIMVNSAVHMVLFPEASRLVNKFGFDQINRVARLWEQLAVALVAVMIFAGSLGAPMLRLLSAPSFHGGTSYIPWLACSAFFYGLSQLGNLPFFIAGKMNKVAIFWSITAGLCLILNGLLIPRLGGLGAAVSQLLTYLVLSLFIITSGHSLMPMPIRWKSLLFILCLALAEIGFASVIVAPNPWIEMLLKFTAASMVSCYILHRIAPSILAQLANQCLSLVRP